MLAWFVDNAIYQQSLNQSSTSCHFMHNYLIFGIICLSVAGIFLASSTISYVQYLEDLAQYEDERAGCSDLEPCFGGRVHFFDLYIQNSVQYAIIGSILGSIGIILLVKKKYKILVPAILAVAIIGTGVYAYWTSASAQSTNLGDILNSVEKIYPQGTTMIGKASTVQETNLKTIASSEESETIDRSAGISKPKFESGRASVELLHGIAPDGNDIIAATITNNGSKTFYLTSLVIFGQTSERIEPLNAYLLDSSYSPEFFGNIPRPAEVSPVAIAPGDSYSRFISGKWSVANQPVQSFSIGAVYQYDMSSTGFVQDNTWSISVASTKLP